MLYLHSLNLDFFQPPKSTAVVVTLITDHFSTENNLHLIGFPPKLVLRFALITPLSVPNSSLIGYAFVFYGQCAKEAQKTRMKNVTLAAHISGVITFKCGMCTP